MKDIVSRSMIAFEEYRGGNVKESRGTVIGNWRKGGSCYIGAGSLTMLLPVATWKMALMKCAV